MNAFSLKTVDWIFLGCFFALLVILIVFLIIKKVQDKINGINVEAEIKKVLYSNKPLYEPYMEEIRQQMNKRTALLN